MIQGKTKEFQRSTNLALVLSTIKQRRGISRIEIANTLGLNRSTITYIVSQLIENRAVYSVAEGTSASKGGRKPVFLDLNPSFGCILGLEVHVHVCRYVILDFSGNIIESRTIEPGPELHTFEDKFIFALSEAKSVVKSLGYTVIGAGIGVPAQVNPYSGLILRSNSMKLNNYDFYTNIASRFPIPILIDNDSNCCAYGELFTNKGMEPKNFLYLLIKYNTHSQDYRETGVAGIGVGIVINHEIYYGNNFLAGEFRSVYWSKNSREQVGIDTEELVSVGSNERTLRKFLRELCFNISTIISIVNPGRIYIGGDICRNFNLINTIIKEELTDSYIAQGDNGCEFFPADYNTYDVAAGAAYMFLERLFALPYLRKIDTYYSLNWEKLFEQMKHSEGAAQ